MTLAWRVTLVLAVLWAVGAEIGPIRSGAGSNPWLDLAVGVSFMTGGLVAWARRPANRIGRILTAAGFAWFAGNYGGGHPFLVWFGSAFDGAGVPIIMHGVFAYPSGRLRPGRERTLIVAGYSILILGAFVSLLFVGRPCPDCEAGLAPFPIGQVEDWLPRLVDGGYLAFSLAALLMLARRFLAATPSRRLGLAELWIAGVIESLSVAATASHFVLMLPLSSTAFTVLAASKILIPASLLFGLFRVELARATIGGLVVDLVPDAEPDDIRSALRRALHDPGLEVAFWVEESGSFVDQDGRSMEVPDGARAVTMIERDGRRLAALLHDAALLDRPDLVRSASAATALALENARLHAEVKMQLNEVRASRARIVEAADTERIRIERDLHDGAQQRLLTLSMTLREARRAAGDTTSTKLLDTAIDDLMTALAELRDLARGVYPAILIAEGLGSALESLAERTPIATHLDIDLPTRPAVAVETTAYFVASEALANVVKHAQADEVVLAARVSDGTLILVVSDDGVGGADPSRGSGMRGLSDRVAALGGRLRVESEPGGGTRLTAEIPCA